MGCIYKTALYLRLSKDDEGTDESQSIKTQRDILREYAKRNGLMIVEEYADDGYSGTNFDRPAFQRMIKDIEAGKINCVLTKDFSRLGRNSARGLDYIDEFFPAHGVRYISVTDGYDSLHLTGGISMAAPMMMFVNEMYARDLSNKIKSAFQIKMQKGECISSFAPYGYKKDLEHGQKNRLAVDWQVAPIVQELFAMAAEGYTPGEIARHMNEKRVATPAVYRCLERPYLPENDSSGRKEWTSQMVCKMLRNEVYLGRTVQGKTKKISFKRKASKSVPREEWIRVEGTHEPLISVELYERVRKRSAARRKEPAKGFQNVFSGIAVCADCGRSMTTAPSRKKGTTCNLCCGGYKAYGAKACSNHFIDYDLLYMAVLEELRKRLFLPEEEKQRMVRELEQAEGERRKRQENDMAVRSISKMEERKQEIGMLLKKLYEDHVFGRISAVTYDSLTAEYEGELLSLDRSLQKIKNQLAADRASDDAYKAFLRLLDEATELQALTKPLLQHLIERIEVEQGQYEKRDDGKRIKKQKIKIYYRFIGCEKEKTTE